jgi:glycosyltransferase involved in cell wall biosynthesis
MKILYIHNNYQKPSGEEHAAEGLVSLLEDHGHTVQWYRRGSAELDEMPLGKVRAVFLSLYNPKAYKAVDQLIRSFQPDVVQVQNLFPLISPRVLKCIKSHHVPLVMRCPNYRLFCPTGLFFDSEGKVCERCTGAGKELNCIRKNCMDSHFKSAAYALRNATARWTDVYRTYVDQFIVQSTFQKQKFSELGVPAERISILPGLTPPITPSTEHREPHYFTFVGRVSREKGIDDIIYAAKKLPHVHFAIAGKVNAEFQQALQLPNVSLKGFLNNEELDTLI